MQTATLSSKGQLVIPRQVRAKEQLMAKDMATLTKPKTIRKLPKLHTEVRAKARTK